MTDPFKARVAGVSLSLMALAFGAFFIVYCLRQWREGQRSAGWPAAEGVITASATRRGRWSERNNDWTVYVTVRYEFEVGGRLYASDRVSFGALRGDDDMYAEARRYGVGERVKVYYDPADPGRSVLEPGVRGGVYKGMAIGAVCALLGCGLIYATFSIAFR